ncbi:hypothetical protein ACFQY0_05960 [Haloferula chungangensis]|uniref:Uncharacterized protein n=1 Tax=Haloferula chungangensis TaxID=1048331 RepID=A0ABW2L4T7_9BACT
MKSMFCHIRVRTPQIITALCAFLVAAPVSAQFQVKEGYRNRFSIQGAPQVAITDPLIPGANDSLSAAYLLQWRSGTALSGTISTRIYEGGNVVSGLPSTVVGASGELILPSGGGVKLASVSMGRPLSVLNTSFSLGSVIPTPIGPTGEADYYLPEPGNQTVEGRRNDHFYWSPHARKVFATQPGVIEIIWKARSGGADLSLSYAISTSAAKPERKIYWTENGFLGPKIEVPTSRVSAVNFVYNSLVPAVVPDADVFVSPYETSNPNITLPKEVRTIWYEPLDQQIHAYNREGRVFLEYLGNLNADGTTREHLGYEIVSIRKETRPITLRVDIGNVIEPPSDIPLPTGGFGPDPALAFSVTAGGGLANDPFVYEHLSLGGSKKTLYAIRKTAPGVYANGQLQQSSNEVLIYWKEEGERGIYWPKYYAGYIFDWPTSEDAYSLYARQHQSHGDAQDTAVVLDAANNPALVYQDDPGKQQAVLAPGNLFYTHVTGPDGRALIRYTNGDDIWFERILSRLDTSYPSFTQTISTDIGTRILPPVGADSQVGYIRQTTGTAFDVDAYIDPFVNGFEEAAKGAIIGINALPGKNDLEIWWYKKSTPPGSKLRPTYWPSYVSVHKLRWPSSPAEIVMASNAGSNALPSIQASGKIYYQNDPAKPGYNPNEEHALMLNGRAWALRNDLNQADSSEPYVLLSFEAIDGRPDMKVFKLLRENETWKFHYPAIAGKIVQSPMPLPILPAPLKEDGSLASYEFQQSAVDIPAGFDMQRDSEFLRYRRFTWTDRKGSVWMMRGPHAGNIAPPATAPHLRMRYFYKTLEGFHYPGISGQPAIGTLTPYLRAYLNPADPTAGYLGDAVSGEVHDEELPRPLDIVFVPTWPASAPELRIGETLTAAKLGLPGVRGQTSAQILYEQSIANDPDHSKPMAARQRSARLFDPTRAKTFNLGGDGDLSELPASIKTSNYLGRTYFPNLPPHLSQRFYFDPAAGGSGSGAGVGLKGQLVFHGSFIDEAAGEKYLQLNILGAADLASIIGLCDSEDAEFEHWQDAINSLSSTVETFKEDPAKRGTYIIDSSGAGTTDPDEKGLTYFRPGDSSLPDRRPQTFGPGEPAEISFSDSAVDSYALAASGGGQGFVVLAVGNGVAFTPPGEPVSLHVVKITAPLYRGEMKVIASANPLDEKLTFQHSGDFSGHPEEYDFEWRYAPPVDGVPPQIYTLERSLIMGDSNGSIETQWLSFMNPGDDYAQLRTADADLGDGSVVNLPSSLEIPPSDDASRPTHILRRTFTSDGDPLRLYLSLDIAAHCGATVYLNQAPVASWNIPGTSNTPRSSSPGSSFSPLSHIFEIPPSVLIAGENVVTLELVSDADPGSLLFANVRLEGTVETEHLSSWLSVSPGPYDTPQGETSGSVTGKSRHVLEGSSILTLTDNYFIVRYRAKSSANAAWQSVVGGGGWSKWTNPQLGEGWIKRVLAGINPFQQRVTDLFNNPVNTDTSILSQAGKRWEGDIALNLENINNFGLIEIYETVLRRGKMLSIEGTPPINYDAANDALLLAAGYLNDLYMLVGNEAFADAANPTIAFSEVLGGNAGSVATSLYAFKGQEPSVLDEELALLRGRDDLLQPGTRVAPAYNRLFWNYTRGIDSGEAIYALNYNIRDMDLDGTVSAVDATQLYPQGHGDAYGHYLTALTNYYGLLNNPNFAWVPRTEAVLVLGQPVQVDYTDERKFAAAAAAIARSANLITDLSYRQQYSATAQSGWSQLKDNTTNPQTGNVRHWGSDEWASRGGQGAYFHWVTANSLLPAVDEDPSHQGIRKIDRTTVPELSEIAAQAVSIQQTLDNADAQLNPLGLSPGAMQFDLDPTFLDVGSSAQNGNTFIQGQTHYDQIYQRALKALTNAATAFSNAEDSTRFLRSQEDSLSEQRAAIAEQEQAYTNQLIEIYGTPYPDDIGPGRTYPQGYAGPDLVHPMYVEITENLAGGGFTPIEESKYTIYTTLDPSILYQIASEGIDRLDPSGEIDGASDPVTYTLGAISGLYRRPDNWNGRRSSPGRMQTAISNELMARQVLFGALYDFDNLRNVIQQRIVLAQSAVRAHQKTLSLTMQNQQSQEKMRKLELAMGILSMSMEELQDSLGDLAGALAEAPPEVAGLAFDLTSGVRAGFYAASLVTKAAAGIVKIGASSEQIASELARENLDQLLEIDIDNANWTHENLQLLMELRQSLQDYVDSSGSVDATMRLYDQAQRELQAVQAEGERLQRQRLVFRQRAAALVQGYRTRDFAFRAFRNEALEKYKSLFDLASKYTYLAASSYDYETGLLDAEGNSTARGFLEQIVKSRAVGTLINDVPQIGGSSTGDPGLAGILARMNGDWSVVKTRFGLNNPDPALTTFSLRSENFRIVNGATGDLAWRDILSAAKKRDIMQDSDVRRYCLQAADANGQEVPGFIIEFSTSISDGLNFFGRPLAGGDHTFTPTAFATKIRSSGIALKGYIGMDSPSTTGTVVSEIGGTSPADPSTAFTSSNALSATPYVYLIPAGADFMRSPPLGESSFIRSWQVTDQAIPLPFNIGGTGYASDPQFVSGHSLSEATSVIRKHQAFRAVPDGTNFPSSRAYTNTRLIGRSAWNSRWKIVIPGRTLLANPEQGLQVFLETVKDIKLHFETYSYSGN